MGDTNTKFNVCHCSINAGQGRVEFPGPVESGFGAISASTGLQLVGHFHAVGPTDNRTGTDRLATVVQQVATGFNQLQPN